jgi:long-chain acyl-CoA synthetase
MTLAERWEATVRRSPSAIAIRDPSRAKGWTRAEVDRLARRWARGVAGGNDSLRGRVIFFAEGNGVAWFERFFGILCLKGVPAPLDPGEPPAAQRAIAHEAGGAYFATAEGLEAIDPRAPRRPAAALIKTTSGSVGRPRALPFSADAMLADGRQVATTMGIGPRDVNFALIPFGHSYGLGNLVIPLLAQGTAIACSSGILPQVWAADIRRWRPTIFPAVPPILAALADSDVKAADFATMRVIISAGSPLDPAIAARFRDRFQRPVHNFYGSSETGGIAYDRTGECTLTGRSVGPPLEGVRLTFGRAQRFVVASAAVGGGRFRPADRGKLNAQGELILLGRTGRTVKLAGKRVDLAEVERALAQVPGIACALVVLPDGARSLAAAISGPALPSAPEIVRLLQPRLAAWKIPRRWAVVSALPVTARGKPDVRAVRRLFA